jgi:broad specificity phosphatase PhoE
MAIFLCRRINERHYGALQGLSKERTADRLGRSIVMEWRRSFEARPPEMTAKHPHYDIIHNDARYARLQEQIPLSESLQDCQKRVVLAWDDIRKDISYAAEDDAPTSLVVAHANSLRALVMSLDGIGAHDIENLNIPTAIPFYYDICKQTGHVLSTLPTGMFRGVYIADERKKRSFLERRRASNDPWLWALHDDQVDKSMLVNFEDEVASEAQGTEGLDGVEEEAKHNTEIFGSSLMVERNGKNVV